MKSDIKPDDQTFQGRLSLALAIQPHELNSRRKLTARVRKLTGTKLDHTMIGKWVDPKLAKVVPVAAVLGVDAKWLAHGPAHGPAPTALASDKRLDDVGQRQVHPSLRKLVKSIDEFAKDALNPTDTEREQIQRAIAKLVAVVAKRGDGDKSG